MTTKEEGNNLTTETKTEEILDNATTEDVPTSLETSPEGTAIRNGTQTMSKDKAKIDILLKATANAPIMKQKKWSVCQDNPIGRISEFIKKYLKLDPNERLNGDESFEDEEGRGRPSVVNNDELKVLIEADPCTIRDLAVKLNVNHPIVLDHLRQLGKSKMLDKWVPHELNESKKNRRYEVCFVYLLRNNNDPFLDCIVTCDEKWILYNCSA
ncbi:histone-lysine N-methyltransferase SETMAR isoform X2 [Harpegnathos saltator]|uniref:histone-lysine N-methyltransferase SETMAR isoform X2 n=1 Tax=Harpegnathos saltator TaxID=610380 RepID=UPI00058E114D|nr:histone-lysine N-methyltransferase SETMAR isoform X2 [Harpegnathos saltator]